MPNRPMAPSPGPKHLLPRFSGLLQFQGQGPYKTKGCVSVLYV